MKEKNVMGNYKTLRTLDYEEMNEHLDRLQRFTEQAPIGYTTFHYPIRHFTYGTGENHVILTAGTHSVELITNCFLIHFMEELDQNPNLVDPNLFTLHFIPILNPEGTIILTSALRTVIPRTCTPFYEELTCLQYYMNSRLEDEYALKKEDHGNKLQMQMFRYADANCIDPKHKELRKSVQKMITSLPEGVMIAWSSNGVGVDLNANIEHPRYEGEVLKKIPVYHELRLNQISKTTPGPVGCPFRGDTFSLEPENQALLNFYHALMQAEKVVGSLIYHACGNQIVYLDEKYGISKEEAEYNRKIALAYQEMTKYDVLVQSRPTTMDYILKTKLPGTILIELGDIRSTPLSQFISCIHSVYDHILEDNQKAIVKTIHTMAHTIKR